MAVEDKYVNTDFGTGTLLDAKTNGGTSPKFLRALVTVAAADDDGSVYRLFRIPSNAAIKMVRVTNTAITGGTDYDLGIYDIDSGAVVDKDLFFDGRSVASAGYGANAFVRTTLVDYTNKLWEYTPLSLTSDPKKEYDVALTANTVGTADGTIVIDMEIEV